MDIPCWRSAPAPATTLHCCAIGSATIGVFAIDLEPELIGLARARLASIGYHPTLVAADGALGLPEHAPYDRIIATCSVPAVPWSWVEQVRDEA